MSKQSPARPPEASSDRKDFMPRGNLAEIDPDVQRLIRLEDERQRRRIILIASESMCAEPVRRANASRFSNVYAEGYPSWRMTEAANHDPLNYVHHLAYYRRYSDGRYYKGCDYVDFAETLAQKRIVQVFANENAPADSIYANVQPLSGAAANNAIYEALVKPDDVVMGMNLAHGGHLTHGSPYNRSGKRYSIVSYGVNPTTGRIDYDEILALAKEHRPKMIIGGASAYPFHIDWAKLREAADACGAYLMADIAHPAGLVAAGLFPNPVGIADVTSFTTHKTMCGPRGACILTTNRRIARKINSAVFPGEQGGPHINAIIAKAVAFKLAAESNHKDMMQRVRDNIDAMAKRFTERGIPLVGGGTETHLLMLDLDGVPSPTALPLKGEVASRILELAGIVMNKNTKPGDTSAAQPGALRIGTVWISQLGYTPDDAAAIADIVSDLLLATHPFRYMESRGYAGRGKVDLDVLKDARARVDALTAKYPVPDDLDDDEPDGYPHFPSAATIARPEASTATSGADDLAAATKDAILAPIPTAHVLELSAERSHYTVHSMATTNTASLGAMSGRRSFLLDRHGNAIDDVSIIRMEDQRPGHRRFLVTTTPSRGDATREWLRALSDGYVLFDDDVFRKVEGPALVVDRSDPGDSHEQRGPLLTLFVLAGPKAETVLSAKWSGPALDADGTVAEGEIGGVSALVHRTTLGGDDRYYEILVSQTDADTLAASLGDARRVEWSTVEALRDTLGLPNYERDPVSAADLAPRYPHMFDATKVYCVGRGHVPAASALPTYAPETADLPLRRTAIYDEHVALGGKIVPFGGWEMPVRYGTSIADEHRAVRETAGLFDVSHMGVLGFRGEHAQRFLDGITSNYVAWLRDGQCHYSYLCAPDGSVLDDILVYRRAWDDYMVVVNAANAEKDLAWIRAAASGDVAIDVDRPGVRLDGPVEIRDLRDPSSGDDRRIDLALQGPKSTAVLRLAGATPALLKALAGCKRFEFAEGEIGGIPALVSKTGYTGSAGYELYVHPDHAVDIWRLLLAKGEEVGLIPTGLGARDSTRTEAGYPLYGHELAGEDEVSPIEAGYGNFVKFHKPFFVGRDPLLAHENARTRTIVRLRLPGKGVKMVRPGNPVLNARGDFIGRITSGVLIGDEQIALAIIDRRFDKPKSTLNVLPLPIRLPKPKSLADLAKGDSVVLPLAATIIKRFM